MGDAFLAQQSDVMAAVQRMRQRAEANGKLQSNPYETVTTQNENGQNAVVIEPANPQVIYVPVYNPEYIWGPAIAGYYPPLYYPGVGVGFTWGPGITIGAYFGGCCGWGGFGWGWAPNWFDHRILVNNYFFHRYGFGEFHSGNFHGTEVWEHNPEHRLGAPYPNRALANQFRGEVRGGAAARNFTAPRGNFNPAPVQRAAPGIENRRFEAPPAQRFGTPGFERGNPGANRSVFGGIRNGAQQRFQSDHGFSTMRAAPRAGGGARVGAPRGGGRRR